MRLTDMMIRKIGSPKSGQKTYFDDNLKGFGVRVSQGGTKSYVVMYGKRRQLKTLGRYPTMTLKDARAAAKRIQGDLALRSLGAWDKPKSPSKKPRSASSQIVKPAISHAPSMGTGGYSIAISPWTRSSMRSHAVM